MRVGQGFDAHRFSDGSQLILGGVTIPHTQGLAAHSDGDVLIHALCDALLGACALGDIGQHFPDTDTQYKNVDSRQLLRHVVNLLVEREFEIINIDATVIAEQPKLAPYILEMRQYLADDMQVALDQVSIKATTTEKMGFTGRAEGIAAQAIAFISGKTK